MMKPTGLFFGSFNPIHNGHLIIAQHLLNTGLFQKIIFVVSPKNPFKNSVGLMDNEFRLNLVKKAIETNPGFEVSSIEFSLPEPSYTADTLKALTAQNPSENYHLIIGSDNLQGLSQWKDIDYITSHHEIHVYRRRGTELETSPVPGIFHYSDAPYIDISATHIRELIAEGKSVRYLVPEVVFSYLK